MNKDELEYLIAEERPVGEFLFDEEKLCFTTGVEVIYELIEIQKTFFVQGNIFTLAGTNTL